MSRILSTLAPESGPGISTAIWFVSIGSTLLMAFLFDKLGFDRLDFEMLGLETLGFDMLGFDGLGLGMLSILTAELRTCHWSGTGSPSEARGERRNFTALQQTFYSILSIGEICPALHPVTGKAGGAKFAQSASA